MAHDTKATFNGTTVVHVGYSATEPTETTSLLSRHEGISSSHESLINEIIVLLRAAAPISFGYLLQNSLQLASIMIIGRLGALELSIAASGFMIATCTGWLLAVGGTTALDALGSKAFTSKAENPKLIGLLLQRCLLIMTVFYIPIALLWCFIGSVLTLCGQSYELAYGTQTFLRCLAPCGLGYVYFESLKKFLQCQNIHTPGTVILLVVAIIHLPICWIVVHVWNFGLIGGVFATGSMYWVACLLTLAYIRFVNGSKALVKPSREVLRDIVPFVRLVGFGLMMVGAEWWAFELIAIAAGAMGDIPIAAQSILMTVDSVFALIPFGLGVASTNRVGNLIGLDQIKQARLAACASSCIAFASGCLTMTTIMTMRGPISRVFSDDAEVLVLAIAVFPWGAAFQVVDSLQAANSGCLRAMGRADIGASVNLVAYYVFAIPIGLGTGFYLNWRLHGLWFGLAFALAIVGIGECVLVNLVPWEKYVDYEEAKSALEDGGAA